MNLTTAAMSAASGLAVSRTRPAWASNLSPEMKSGIAWRLQDRGSRDCRSECPGTAGCGAGDRASPQIGRVGLKVADEAEHEGLFSRCPAARSCRRATGCTRLRLRRPRRGAQRGGRSGAGVQGGRRLCPSSRARARRRAAWDRRGGCARRSRASPRERLNQGNDAEATARPRISISRVVASMFMINHASDGAAL